MWSLVSRTTNAPGFIVTGAVRKDANACRNLQIQSIGLKPGTPWEMGCSEKLLQFFLQFVFAFFLQRIGLALGFLFQFLLLLICFLL